jgi:hypothetical protein
VDTSTAEKSPGVLAVLSHLNAPKLPARTELGGPVSRQACGHSNRRWMNWLSR